MNKENQSVSDALKIIPASGERPHIFVDVAFDLVPEIPYKDLLYLSRLVEHSKREKLYETLIDSLRKTQWAKLAGSEAIFIEGRIAERVKPNVIPFDPVGQAQHAKALFDYIAHSKAALDSLAVFLNDFLGIGRRGGRRDFRIRSFCEEVRKKDITIGKCIDELREWFNKDRASSDSLIATRDEWLHRGSPAITAMYPPNEIGYLPVPKWLQGGYPALDKPLSKEYYWTTQELVEFHYKKLTYLFNTIATRCIEIEEVNSSKAIDRNLLPATPISVFPLRGTKDTAPRQYTIRQFTAVLLDANEIWEELPHKILKLLSPTEAGTFAKLAKYRTFSTQNRGLNFIAMTDNFLGTVLQISTDSIRALCEIGLIMFISLVLENGTTFVCGSRGFRIYWSDNQPRNIQVVYFTRLGRTLAGLVKVECDDGYVKDIISVMNSNRVNIRLMAISDLDDKSFKYDDMGSFEYK